MVPFIVIIKKMSTKRQTRSQAQGCVAQKRGTEEPLIVLPELVASMERIRELETRVNPERNEHDVALGKQRLAWKNDATTNSIAYKQEEIKNALLMQRMQEKMRRMEANYGVCIKSTEHVETTCNDRARRLENELEVFKREILRDASVTSEPEN